MSSDPHARLASSWQDNARVWAAAVRDGALESRRVATDAAIVAAVLETGARSAVDVGCGEGWLSRRLAAEGLDVLGFDASAELIERAREHEGPRFLVLDYDELARDPARVGRPFDLAVCNFSLLGERVRPVLMALHHLVEPTGHLLIQTLHPLATTGMHRYEDGWRQESFDGLPGAWTAMPWYFRTAGSWLTELHATGWQVEHMREPTHPVSGAPLSLIWHARKRPN